MLDGNPRLNLASFVTTWMEPECDKLIMAALNKNYIDMDEYPITTELQVWRPTIIWYVLPLRPLFFNFCWQTSFQNGYLGMLRSKGSPARFFSPSLCFKTVFLVLFFWCRDVEMKRYIAHPQKVQWGKRTQVRSHRSECKLFFDLEENLSNYGGGSKKKCQLITGDRKHCWRRNLITAVVPLISVHLSHDEKTIWGVYLLDIRFFPLSITMGFKIVDGWFWRGPLLRRPSHLMWRFVMQDRCVNMIARLFNAPIKDGTQAVGAGTVGSSEAIMLAGLAFKRKWQNERKAAGLPYDKPNLVTGANVQVLHPSGPFLFLLCARRKPGNDL